MKQTQNVDIDLNNPLYVQRILNQYSISRLDLLKACVLANNGGERIFSSYNKKTSIETDFIEGIIGKPAELSEDSELPEIIFTPLSKESGAMGKLGFTIRYTKEFFEKPNNKPIILSNLREAGYIMKRILDAFIYKEIIAFASMNNSEMVPAITPTDGKWNKPEGNDSIDDDVKKMMRAMESQKNYKGQYKLDTIFIYQEGYWAMNDYYDVAPIGNGQGFNPNNIHGASVHQADELNEGLIGYDSRVQPIVLRYNLDPSMDHLKGKEEREENRIVQVHPFKSRDTDEIPHQYGYNIIADVGVDIQHAPAIIVQDNI